MAGKIKKMIDLIVQGRSRGNPAIAEMTKAKFILKGINPDRYDFNSEDDPVILEKLRLIDRDFLNSCSYGAGSNIKAVSSDELSEDTAVFDIKSQLSCFGAKLIIFFASSRYDQEKISLNMQKAFPNSVVFGCSTAGELVSGKMLKNSVAAMAFNSNIFSDAKMELVDLKNIKTSVEEAFVSFEHYYNESAYLMDTEKYVGIILVDGISMKEETVMDLIGNRTNISFVGGAAGDDLRFSKTYIYAGGRAYSDSAILVLLRMNENAAFSILKTQSFKVLDKALIANRVDEKNREVLEFNNRPAISAYADAVGAASDDEAPNYFTTNPVGLNVAGNGIFVRSPRQRSGSSIKFYCNLIEGMEVRVLESTDIIDDTRRALDQKIEEFGRIDGMINFNCIERTIELEKKNLTEQYGNLFRHIPTVGFSTYGEEFIGHMNQTSTMLAFQYNPMKNFNYQRVQTPSVDQRDREPENQELVRKIENLNKIIQGKNQQLEETTAALREFNEMLKCEICERTKREERISDLSYRDELTGLHNRRFYEEEIQKIDTSENLPITVIIGDVNGLKLVNDTLGHDKGDELLLKAANGIQKVCREGDCTVRWGGDEFVILLPKTGSEAAEKVVRRMNESYQEEKTGDLQVSVSFGWETKEEPNEDIMEVLKKAEAFMYKQKKDGRLVCPNCGYAIRT